MYYLLLILIALLAFYTATHIVGSVVKGCIMVVVIMVIGFMAFLLVKSTKEPVNILNRYSLVDFELIKK